MGLLDFIVRRNRQPVGKPQITKADRIAAEIQHDESLARKRDATGQEHTAEEGKVPEALVVEKAKARLESLGKVQEKRAKEAPGRDEQTMKRQPSWER